MSRRSGLGVLAIASALLVVVWRILPAASPPVYDGLCLADPYRLLGSSPAPATASQSYQSGNNFPTSEVLTTENPAQAQLLMTDGTFISPQSAFKVSITPVPPPAVRPTSGTIDGNVYSIAAATLSGTALTPKQPVTIVLRGTASTGPTRTIERLDGTTWTPLKTYSAGCGDTFETASNRMGDFAIVAASGSTSPQSSSGGAPLALIVGLILVVLIVSVLGLLRINRTRNG